MVHDSKWFYWIFKKLAVFWKEKEKVIGIECVEECEEERDRTINETAIMEERV